MTTGAGDSSGAPLLEVTGLRIASRDRVLVDNLSFSLVAGESLGIVGESGSGKTLATRAIPGLLAPGLSVTGGSIRLEGLEITRATEGQLRAVRGPGVGLVFQEPMTSLNPALTIGFQLAEALRLHSDLSDAEIRRRSIEMLERVHIKDAEASLRRYPHEFSGGMRQRIMLASVLMLAPRLLIADEPTTALDTLSQREVLEVMRELTSELGTGLLLITHDLGLVARYTERVLVMERGVLVESGSTRDVLAHPAHPYTRQLVGALPRRPDSRPVPPAAAPLLEVKDLYVSYPGLRRLWRTAEPVQVLKGVDLAVAPGEVVALVGASGSGKTTLGRAVMGLAPAAQGAIRYRQQDIAQMDRAHRRHFRREVQMIFQDPHASLDPRMKIGAIVAAALRHLPGMTRADIRDRVDAALEAVELPGFAGRFAHEMSGGQRQRVAIARAIVSRPRLVVADEPVSALDLTIQRQVIELVQRLQRENGFACLFITHDLAVVEQVADRMVVLQAGEVAESGVTDAVLARPTHEYTRALLAAAPQFELAGLAMDVPGP